MSLYNCKCDGDHWRISKFTNDLDVEASYLVSNEECDCPAGHRPVCRHRIMLVRFIAKNATAGQWFHNYEHNQWIRALAEEPDTLGDLASAASEVTSPVFIDDYGPVPDRVWNEDQPKLINLLELAKPTPAFNPTAGIPKTSFGQKDAPNFDNATWFSTVQPEKSINDAFPPKPLRRL